MCTHKRLHMACRHTSTRAMCHTPTARHSLVRVQLESAQHTCLCRHQDHSAAPHIGTPRRTPRGRHGQSMCGTPTQEATPEVPISMRVSVDGGASHSWAVQPCQQLSHARLCKLNTRRGQTTQTLHNHVAMQSHVDTRPSPHLQLEPREIG